MRPVRVLFVAAVMLAAWTSPAAAEVRQLKLRVEVDDGVVWATARVSCDPEIVDDVEVDVYLTQGANEAHIDLFGQCPPQGLLEVRSASFDTDPLDPGRVDAYIVEQQYCTGGGGATCAGGESGASVMLTPAPRGRG